MGTVSDGYGEGYRICSVCGKRMEEGWFHNDEVVYACSEECCLALYEGDRKQMEDDMEDDIFFWTFWYDEIWRFDEHGDRTTSNGIYVQDSTDDV